MVMMVGDRVATKVRVEQGTYTQSETPTHGSTNPGHHPPPAAHKREASFSFRFSVPNFHSCATCKRRWCGCGFWFKGGPVRAPLRALGQPVSCCCFRVTHTPRLSSFCCSPWKAMEDSTSRPHARRGGAFWETVPLRSFGEANAGPQAKRRRKGNSINPSDPMSEKIRREKSPSAHASSVLVSTLQKF